MKEMPSYRLFPIGLRTARVPNTVIRSVPPNVTNDRPSYRRTMVAQLHPEHLRDRYDNAAKSQPAAIQMTHVVHAEAFRGMHIALNWFCIDKDGSFWYGGGTGGYSAFMLFNPQQDFGLVVLCNTSYERGGLTDQLGELITQRLEGTPAIVLSYPK